MSYRTTTFGNIKQHNSFFYDKQRWYKATSTLERTKHNAHTSDGTRYKWFRSNTSVKVEVK